MAIVPPRPATKPRGRWAMGDGSGDGSDPPRNLEGDGRWIGRWAMDRAMDDGSGDGRWIGRWRDGQDDGGHGVLQSCFLSLTTIAIVGVCRERYIMILHIFILKLIIHADTYGSIAHRPIHRPSPDSSPIARSIAHRPIHRPDPPRTFEGDGRWAIF